jgi:hypothetical protein
VAVVSVEGLYFQKGPNWRGSKPLTAKEHVDFPCLSNMLQRYVWGCGGMAPHNQHFGLRKGELSVLCSSHITPPKRVASAHWKQNGSRVYLDTAVMKRENPYP